jgi:hypothetical protein
MDPVLVTDAAVKDKIRCAWAKWQRCEHYYSDEIMSWERCVKPQLLNLLRQEEAERRANYRNMEITCMRAFMTYYEATPPRGTSCPPYYAIRRQFMKKLNF